MTGDKTVYEAEKTVYEGGRTVLEGSQTVLEGGQTVAEGNDTVTEASGQAVFSKGESILDTYRVESAAIESGGMGRVWRVHHGGWNVDLAMKQPRPEHFADEDSKTGFIRECQTWINLGLHPHVVSCYYVREIERIPTIFSEWMDGGSLADVMESGKLYEGTEEEQGRRILDIAIQFARGLHYAHEFRDENGEPQGLVHQDVKPGNLLLTGEWEAKVADFGLARARALLTMEESSMTGSAECGGSNKTMYSHAGGYTPAYCSMEQMDGHKLTRRTDIYSWAVSVMEMYVGSLPWANGVVAGLNCREYFEMTRVLMPGDMKKLLAKCLESEENARPRDFIIVEEELLRIYQDATGNPYPRPVSKAAADTADSLNNRALSFLDLGKPEEAERCWERAFALHGKSGQTLYNHTLYQLLYDMIPAEEALNRYMTVWNGSPESDILLMRLYALCGKWKEAQKIHAAIQKSKGIGGGALEGEQTFSVPSMMRWPAEPAVARNCRCALSPDGTLLLRALQPGQNDSWTLEVRDVAKNQPLTSAQIPTLNWHWFVSEIAWDDQSCHIACLVGTLRTLEISYRFQSDRDGTTQSRRYEDYYLSNTKLLVWRLERDGAMLLHEIPLHGDAPYNRNALLYQRGLAFLGDGRITVLLKQGEESQEKKQYDTLLQYVFDPADGALQACEIPVDCEPNCYGYHQLSSDGSVALIQTLNGMELLREKRLYPLPAGCIPRLETEERLRQAEVSVDGQSIGFSHVLQRQNVQILVLRCSSGQKYKSLPYTLTTRGNRGIKEFQLNRDGRILLFCEWIDDQHTRLRAVDTQTGQLLGAAELDADVSAMLLSKDDRVLLFLSADMQPIFRLELQSFLNGQKPYVLCRVTSSGEKIRQEDILRDLLAEFEAAYEPFDFNRCMGSIRRMTEVVPDFEGSEHYIRLTERVQARSKKGRFIRAELKQVFEPGSDKVFHLLLPSGKQLVRIETEISSYATAAEPTDVWHMNKQELIELSLKGIANCSSFMHFDNTYSLLYEVDQTRFIYNGVLYDVREGSLQAALRIHPCTRKAPGNFNSPQPMCLFPDRSAVLNGDVITSLADGKKTKLPTEVLNGNPRCIRIASNGNRICYANSITKDAAIFDCEKQAFTLRFTGHTDRVVHAEFLQNDSLVITLSHDKTMRVYDTHTGECTKVLKTDIGKAICLVKSHDERYILALGEGMKAELWDIAAYELLAAIRLNGGKMKTACFSPDQTQVLIRNIEKGGAWLYALKFEYQIAN